MSAPSHPRIVLLPADDTGCGRYRMVWPGNYLRRNGHDVVVNRYRRDHEVQITVVNREGTNGRWIVHDVHPVDADMVVFQRPNTQRLYTTIRKIQSQGVKVGVDVDDALWDVDRRNIAYKYYNGDTVNGPHWKWLVKSCNAADLVTTSTPELAEKFPKNSVTVPNFVPSYFLGNGRGKLAAGVDPGFSLVGWGATIFTHPGDPKVVDGRLPEIVRPRNAGFLAVGGGAAECKAFGFTEDDIDDSTAASTGLVPMKEWIRSLSVLDVSLVPLADTPFNRGKSWLKAIESASAGAVPVMSPTPDNVRVKGAGVGLLAGTGQKWDKRIRRLLDEPGYRHEVAEAGLEAVGKLTVEENGWRWLEAWEQAWR